MESNEKLIKPLQNFRHDFTYGQSDVNIKLTCSNKTLLKVKLNKVLYMYVTMYT